MCEDWGWVHPKGRWGALVRCVCKREQDLQERQARLLKHCNLPRKREGKTLESYQTRGHACLDQALKYARAMAAGDEAVIFLTLVGQSDVGKSHLAIGVCRQWLERQQAAHYVNVPRMLNDLREGYARDAERSFDSRLKFYSEVGLLILDDLGTQKVSEWGAEQLQTVINARYEEALHTVVTTNRPIDDLFNWTDNRQESWREFANMRVASRLQRESWCQVVLMDVPPYVGGS